MSGLHSVAALRAAFAGGEGDGKVWVNRPAGGRGAKPPSLAESWRLPNGATLPPDGFYAETQSARAGIVEIGGRRCAFSQSSASVFVDSRKSKNVNGAVDFASLGPGVKTDGAFRLERDKADGGLVLTPLPESGPFRAEIDLASIALLAERPSPDGVAALAVVAVEPVEPALDAAWPAWSQTDGVLSLSVDAKAFAYRIRLGRIAAP